MDGKTLASCVGHISNSSISFVLGEIYQSNSLGCDYTWCRSKEQGGKGRGRRKSSDKSDKDGKVSVMF